MIENIKKLKVSSPDLFSFFYAIGPEAAGLKYDDAASLEYFGRSLSKAEVSCFSSHYKIIHDFVNNDTSDYLLVMEDDIYIDPNFNFTTAFNMMDMVGIDYLRLYSRSLPARKLLNYTGRMQLYRIIWDCGGTQAYIYSRAGAKRFLEKVRLGGTIKQPIDNEMDMYWETNNPLYAIYPYPVLELFEATTIHTGAQIAERLLKQNSVTLNRHSKFKKIYTSMKAKIDRRLFELNYNKYEINIKEKTVSFFKIYGDNCFSTSDVN